MNKNSKGKLKIALAILLVVSGTFALFSDSVDFFETIKLKTVNLEVTEYPSLKIPDGVEGSAVITNDSNSSTIIEEVYIEPSFYYSNSYKLELSENVDKIIYTSDYEGTMSSYSDMLENLNSAEAKMKESDYEGYLSRAFLTREDGTVIKELVVGESDTIDLVGTDRDSKEFYLVTLNGLGYNSNNDYLNTTFKANWSFTLK